MNIKVRKILEDMKYDIDYRRERFIDNLEWKKDEYLKEKEKRKKWVSTTVNDIKYMDKVKIYPGCLYYLCGYYDKRKKPYKSLAEAIEAYKKRNNGELSSEHSQAFFITIINPMKNKYIEDSVLFAKEFTFRESKDAFSEHMHIRTIMIASDLSEVYSEYFEVPFDEECMVSCNCVYDYGFLYGNYPIFLEEPICISKFFAVDEERNISFTPYLFRQAWPEVIDTVCNRKQDIIIGYRCYGFKIFYDGSVYDTDFHFPMEVIPVSTFIQIGNSKMSCKCWRELLETSLFPTYIYKGKSYNVLFEVFIEMAADELSENPYYTLTVDFDNKGIDGIIPDIPDDITMDEKQKLLSSHAKKRDFFVAPTLDAFLGERFELKDSDGNVKEFVFEKFN